MPHGQSILPSWSSRVQQLSWRSMLNRPRDGARQACPAPELCADFPGEAGLGPHRPLGERQLHLLPHAPHPRHLLRGRLRHSAVGGPCRVRQLPPGCRGCRQAAHHSAGSDPAACDPAERMVVHDLDQLLTWQLLWWCLACHAAVQTLQAAATGVGRRPECSSAAGRLVLWLLARWV